MTIEFNKKLILTLVLIFTVCANLLSNENKIKIHGKIISSENEIINYGLVRIKDTNTISLISPEGKYEFLLNPGDYTFVVNIVGYESIEQKIKLKGEKTITKNFTINPEVHELDEFVAKGKSPIAKIKESAFNAIAIDAKALHNTTLDIASALDRISGVKLRSNGGVGSDFSFSLNGFSGKHIKFFIDGVPMDGFGSQLKINNIPISMVDRIEVYKGVVPVGFGSDALGGVVNIVTNKSSNTRIDVSAAAGSFNTYKTNLNLVTTTSKGLSAQFNLFHNYSDNNYPVLVRIDNLTTGLSSNDSTWVNRFNDKFWSGTFISKLGFVNKKFADRLFVGFTYGKGRKGIQHALLMDKVFGERHERSETIMPTFEYAKKNLFIKGLDSYLTANYNLGHTQMIDTASYRYNWKGEKKELGSKGEAGGNPVYSKFYNNNGSATIDFVYSIGERQKINVNNVLSYFNRKVENAFARKETNEEKAEADKRINIKNIVGVSYAYSIQDLFNISVFGKQYNTLSIINKNRRPFSTTGYGVAGTYIWNNIQIKGSYEKTYRLPSVNEMFGDGGLEWGNNILRPEQGNNINLNLGYSNTLRKRHSIFFDGGYVRRSITDYIIRSIAGAGSRAEYDNHGKVLSSGVNVEARYIYNNIFNLGGNFTYQSVRDNERYRQGGFGVENEKYGVRVPNVPYMFGNADAGFTIKDLFVKGNNLTLGYHLQYIKKFYYSWDIYGYDDNRSTIPTQLSHDIDISYPMFKNRINLTAECNNLTNSLLYDNFSFQKPGRNFMFKIRYIIL